ncbi:MAG: acyl carrier protein [Butyricicoccus pullicaecorum]|nr:acyl carrier protein [Butyricicoccus pullicaecorum]MDO4669253.1 acyl carrier protein [Butyricicoccus pullicaecorum]
MVFEKMVELLSEQFGVEPESITLKTSFDEDLGADSLDLVELMMALEEEFDVGEIDEETAQKLKTVGDVVDFVGSQDE